MRNLLISVNDGKIESESHDKPKVDETYYSEEKVAVMIAGNPKIMLLMQELDMALDV